MAADFRALGLGALLTVTLIACGGTADEATATAADTATSTPTAPKVQIGDRFGVRDTGGTFRVGVAIPGTPTAVPPGEYRLTFATDLQTDEPYTSGLWIRCSALPCEPDKGRENVIASGVVGVDRRTGEARSQSIAGDGSVIEHGTTLTLDKADGAVYLQHLSMQLLSFG